MDSIYTAGEKVDLIILRETELGFVAMINGKHEGLLYHDEIFKQIEIDEEVTGYIKKVRYDKEIDLLLESFGHLGAEELGNHILEVLKQRKGFLPINAKSPAEDVYNLFGVSRKKFKIALGYLYKKRLVDFTEDGTELLTEPEAT